MTMGEIRASVTLENTSDRDRVYDGHGVEAEVRRRTVEGIVDTGAVNLVIPEELARELASATGGREPRSTPTNAAN